jgi:hypothetical protein
MINISLISKINPFLQKNIKPTSDDYHWMMTCIEEFKEMVLNVINTQSLVGFNEYYYLVFNYTTVP